METTMSGLTHLDELEAEAIYIIREVAAECEKPVMLYSIGKDSSVTFKYPYGPNEYSEPGISVFSLPFR